LFTDRSVNETKATDAHRDNDEHDRGDFDDVVDDRARTRRVIAIDWPGHGESPLPIDGRELATRRNRRDAPRLCPNHRKMNSATCLCRILGRHSTLIGTPGDDGSTTSPEMG